MLVLRLACKHRDSLLSHTLTVEITDPLTNWPRLPTNVVFPRLAAHDKSWLAAVTKGLKHRAFLLVNKDADGSVDGQLPIVLMKSALFGKFLISVPYINTGGVWATNESAAQSLISEACCLADEYDVRYLELRHEVPVQHPKFNFTRSDKVHMRLDLPPTTEELDASFKAKLRNQIKKALEYEPFIEWGGTELLNDFYGIFAVNMRDLGTPVFSKDLFRETLREFSGDSELAVVRQKGKAVAAAMLVHGDGVSEVPSASCLRQFNRTNANMWMYRNLLGRTIERGNSRFDFGRSSEGSGTYRFKAQWGAKPHPTTWQYYIRKGSAEDMRADSGRNKRLVEIWKKLPVTLTKLIGPAIVRGIP